MKAKVWIQQEVDIAFIRVVLPVRYEEEDIPNDFPLREDDVWKVIVAIDNGEIQGWPKGIVGEIECMKVCDSGTYRLLNHAGEEVASIENDYVPHGVIPGQYGDYVTLQIDANGIITNWPKKPDVSAFFPQPE